jgi:hypothetical protein
MRVVMSPRIEKLATIFNLSAADGFASRESASITASARRNVIA